MESVKKKKYCSGFNLRFDIFEAMLLRCFSNRFATSRILGSVRLYSTQPLKSINYEETSNETASNEKSLPTPMTFAKMFRHSKFVQLGGLKGRLLSGRIVDVVDDDLYIDYGGKFHAVVQRPQNKQRDQYVIGTVVSLRLQSWEMAARFLGASKHISLLESDAQLVGILKRMDRVSKPRDKDLDLRYKPGDRQAPITAKREVL